MRLQPRTFSSHSQSHSTSKQDHTHEVQFEKHGSSWLVTLNRPKALNSLNLSMVREIYPKFKSWSNDSSVSHIVMKGTGKAFCAGGDIRAVYDSGKSKGNLTHDFFKEEYQLNYLIHSYPKPQVALLNGITMGGGVGLSIHGKYRVATDKTVFAMPETGIGFFCDVGGSYFLSRLPGATGTYLALTGARITGQEMFHIGLATHYVPHEDLSKLEEELINTNNPEQVLQKHSKKPVEFDTKNPEFELIKEWDAIQRIFSLQTIEDIMNALKEEEGKNAWAKDTLLKLNTMSPTSLKVVLEQVQRGKNLNLKECLKMEYRISQHFMQEGSDFYEGVRALLVDKDKRPMWKPQRITDVSRAATEAYFAKLDPSRELHFPCWLNQRREIVNCVM